MEGKGLIQVNEQFITKILFSCIHLFYPTLEWAVANGYLTFWELSAASTERAVYQNMHEILGNMQLEIFAIFILATCKHEEKIKAFKYWICYEWIN